MIPDYRTYSNANSFMTREQITATTSVEFMELEENEIDAAELKAALIERRQRMDARREQLERDGRGPLRRLNDAGVRFRPEWRARSCPARTRRVVQLISPRGKRR